MNKKYYLMGWVVGLEYNDSEWLCSKSDWCNWNSENLKIYPTKQKAFEKGLNFQVKDLKHRYFIREFLLESTNSQDKYSEHNSSIIKEYIRA